MFSNVNSNPNVPAFITKLWHMVSNKKSDDLICWNNNGTSFIIKNHATFSAELLPMYYKHNNMASFIRQLNKYDFHKVLTVDASDNEKADFEFVHPDFIKGRPDLLVQIKRKLTNSLKEQDYKNDSNLVTKLLKEVQQLHAKQEIFETKLSVMKNENDALWREQSILRQRHHKQQKIVNKLLQFLLTLVQQTRGLNMNRRLPLMLKDCTRPDRLKAIKDSGSLFIRDVDANDGFSQNIRQASAGTIGNSNAFSKVLAPSTIQIKTNPTELHLRNTVPSTTSTNDVNIYLSEEPDKPLIEEHDLSVPPQEISPAIVQSHKQPHVSYNLFNNSTRRKEGTSLLRRGIKRKYISPKNAEAESRLLIVSDLTNGSKYSEDQELHGNPHLIESTSDNNSNMEWDCNGINCLALPTVTSPSGSVLITEPTTSGEDVPSNKEEELNTGSSSLVVTDLAPVINKEEIDNHLDMVQSDLDLLKDILHNEGLSLDASTLMGLFNSDDPLSLNLPEAGRHNNDSDDQFGSGNEVVAYSPNLFDISEILDDQQDDYSSTSIPSPRELNTPIVEINSPFQSHEVNFPAVKHSSSSQTGETNTAIELSTSHIADLSKSTERRTSPSKRSLNKRSRK